MNETGDHGASEVRKTRSIATARRSLWGVGDQVLYATSNVAVTFIAARVLDSRSFGSFALIYTAAVIVMTTSRSVTSEPFAVLHSDSEPRVQQQEGPKAAGLAATIGAVGGVMAIGIGLATGQFVLIAFGVTMPFLCMQDYARYHLISTGRVRSSFLNDLTWVVVELLAIGILVVSDRLMVVTLVAAWGCGAAASVALARLQLGFSPRIAAAATWWRATRRYSKTYFAESLAVASSGRSIVYVVGGLAGLGQAGAYRGGQALYGPLTMTVGGLRVVALPEMVRRRGSGVDAIRRASLAIAIGLGALGLVATAALYVAGPWVGPLLLGDTWSGARLLVIPLGIGRAADGAAAGPFLGLRAIGATKASVRVRWGGSMLGLALAIVGTVLGGASGAAWGYGIGMIAMTAMWYVAFAAAANATTPADLARLQDLGQPTIDAASGATT